MSRLSLLPENQIVDLLTSISSDVRDIKLMQKANTAGLLFYQSQNASDWDFNKTVPTVGGVHTAAGVPLVVTVSANADTMLLADIIVIKALINDSSVSQINADLASPTQKNRSIWRVMLTSQATGNVLVRFKCAIVSNTDVTINVEYGS